MQSTNIERLQHSSLPESVQLLNHVFPRPPLSEHPCLALPLSLAPPLIAKPVLSLVGVTSLQYWVIKPNQAERRVLGITGLYSQWQQPDACWLGWTCVQPNVRQQGLGSKLLDFAIAQARKGNKQTLQLYTSTDPEFQAARCLYDSRGFKHYEAQPLDSTSRLYLQLMLC